MVRAATGTKGEAASSHSTRGSSIGIASASVRGCTMNSKRASALARWRARLARRKFGPSAALCEEDGGSGRAENLQASSPQA